jgi:predicted nucleotidyltransferase component of viral defense system
MSDIQELDITAWVERAPAAQREFREAVHVVLDAITGSSELRSKMVMKGGLLMAIRYSSTRFTRDIDFSTCEPYRIGAETALLQRIAEQLTLAIDRTAYDIRCVLQRHKVQPGGVDKTFPALSLAVGYARPSNRRALERLLAGQSPGVVAIDYSYNEAVYDVEVVGLGDGHELMAYSLYNVLAEKLRSLRQQPVRKRNRRQDVYDLYLLMTHCEAFSEYERAQVHTMLVASCRSKGIDPDETSILDASVRSMAEYDYELLKDEVQADIPSFAVAYKAVVAFYQAMPWSHDRGQSNHARSRHYE